MNLDAKLPGYLAARMVNVSRQLVHYWRRSGRLHPVGRDERGHPLYRLGDVLAVESATRNTPQSHRAA